MKYIIVLGDGMADEPIGKLGGRTPLQAADTPAMDWLAAHGRCGLLKTVPDGYHPGSEIANLSVLGYDVPKVFEGRGSLEAARKRDRQRFPYFLKFIIKEILRLFEFITQKSPQTFHLWGICSFIISRNNFFFNHNLSLLKSLILPRIFQLLYVKFRPVLY